MTSVLLPPYLYPDEETVEVIDRTSAVFRPEFAQGIVQRQEQAAPILRVNQKYSGMSSSQRGVLLSFLRQCRGRVNTIYLTPLKYAPRGSFPASELLSNNTFENGTTEWNSTSEYSASVQDRIYRGTKNASGTNAIAILQTPTVVQYAPYVTRAVARFSRTPTASTVLLYSAAEVGISCAIPVNGGYAAVATVSNSTSLGSTGIIESAGFYAGDYIEVPWISCSRCALVDNGPNLLLRSDDFDNAAWSYGGGSVTANAATAPDGTTTADGFDENGATTDHYVIQSVTVGSAAADYAFTIGLKAAGRSWVRIILDETTGSSSVNAYFNISTGAVGTVSASTNWSNGRAFIKALGNGWFACSVVGRKTNSATTIRPYVVSTTADGAGTGIAGISATAFYPWRATLAQSSVPTRLVQTTSAATSGSNQTGSALYIKGLPASTSGLLLAGDLVEIGGELKQVSASLNSDAGGLGYLQFEPPLFRSPADNDPVIVCNPMGKFILSDNGKAANRLGRYADVELSFEEIYE